MALVTRSIQWDDARPPLPDMAVCEYCGVAIAATAADFGRRPSWDHRVPMSQGGLDDAENLVLSCRRCNSMKGTGSLVMLLHRLRAAAAMISGISVANTLVIHKHGALPEQYERVMFFGDRPIFRVVEQTFWQRLAESIEP